MWWMDGDETVVRAGRWSPLVSFLSTFAITLVSGAVLSVFLDLTWRNLVMIAALLAVIEACVTFGRRRRLDDAIDPNAAADDQEALLDATEGRVEALPAHLVGDARRLIESERSAADRKYHRGLLFVGAVAAVILLRVAWSRDLTLLTVSAPALLAAVVITRWVWSRRRRQLHAAAAAVDERFP